MHAGAGTALVLVQVSALIPGLLPSLALFGLIAAVVLLPVLAVVLAATLVLAAPYGAWRLARSAWRRARRTRAA